MADSDPEYSTAVQRSLGRLLSTIRSDRQTMITLLEGMDDTGLQRTGQHARYGLFPQAQWVEFFLLHEAHHLYTIFMLVQEMRKNLP